MQRRAGFALLEIVIAIFILLLILGMAVPSVNGVFADKRLHRSVDRLHQLVHEAHERSLAERRAYLIVFDDRQVSLQPSAFAKDEEHKAIDAVPVSRGEKWSVELPAALSKKRAPEWIFWESGVCEPARITYASADGKWSAEYSPLTALGQMIAYGPR